MKKVLTGALTALTLLGATTAGVSGASAAPRHGWRGGYDRGGGAVAAGILGLGIGAALASPYYGPPGPYYYGPAPYYGYGCPAWHWSPRWRRYACY